MLIINLNQNKSDISYISSTLLEKIEETLSQKKKSILYINKRWEYSSLVCKKCHHLYKCPHCDISLSVHKYPEQLKCHICDFQKSIDQSCEICRHSSLEKIWIWTQQIEYSLKEYFWNNINIFRFDTDSVKNKNQKSLVLENIEKADIIIWTKMITTGFNIKNLWLIGVILLEQELQVAHYNIEEKVYANLKQLIGRGNRNWEQTEILLQTFIPENEIIKNLTDKNYKDFFVSTLKERKMFLYPPFTQWAYLEYRHQNQEKAIQFMEKIFLTLSQQNTEKKYEIIFIKSPQKRHKQFYYKIVLKWDNIRSFLECIKIIIFKNSNFSVTFL